MRFFLARKFLFLNCLILFLKMESHSRKVAFEKLCLLSHYITPIKLKNFINIFIDGMVEFIYQEPETSFEIFSQDSFKNFLINFRQILDLKIMTPLIQAFIFKFKHNSQFITRNCAFGLSLICSHSKFIQVSNFCFNGIFNSKNWNTNSSDPKIDPKKTQNEVEFVKFQQSQAIQENLSDNDYLIDKILMNINLNTELISSTLTFYYYFLSKYDTQNLQELQFPLDELLLIISDILDNHENREINLVTKSAELLNLLISRFYSSDPLLSQFMKHHVELFHSMLVNKKIFISVKSVLIKCFYEYSSQDIKSFLDFMSKKENPFGFITQNLELQDPLLSSACLLFVGELACSLLKLGYSRYKKDVDDFLQIISREIATNTFPQVIKDACIAVTKFIEYISCNNHIAKFTQKLLKHLIEIGQINNTYYLLKISILNLFTKYRLSPAKTQKRLSLLNQSTIRFPPSQELSANINKFMFKLIVDPNEQVSRAAANNISILFFKLQDKEREEMTIKITKKLIHGYNRKQVMKGYLWLINSLIKISKTNKLLNGDSHFEKFIQRIQSIILDFLLTHDTEDLTIDLLILKTFSKILELTKSMKSAKSGRINRNNRNKINENNKSREIMIHLLKCLKICSDVMKKHIPEEVLRSPQRNEVMSSTIQLFAMKKDSHVYKPKKAHKKPKNSTIYIRSWQLAQQRKFVNNQILYKLINSKDKNQQYSGFFQFIQNYLLSPSIQEALSYLEEPLYLNLFQFLYQARHFGENELNLKLDTFFQFRKYCLRILGFQFQNSFDIKTIGFIIDLLNKHLNEDPRSVGKCLSLLLASLYSNNSKMFQIDWKIVEDEKKIKVDSPRKIRSKIKKESDILTYSDDIDPQNGDKTNDNYRQSPLKNLLPSKLITQYSLDNTPQKPKPFDKSAYQSPLKPQNAHYEFENEIKNLLFQLLSNLIEACKSHFLNSYDIKFQEEMFGLLRKLVQNNYFKPINQNLSSFIFDGVLVNNYFQEPQQINQILYFFYILLDTKHYENLQITQQKIHTMIEYMINCNQSNHLEQANKMDVVEKLLIKIYRKGVKNYYEKNIYDDSESDTDINNDINTSIFKKIESIFLRFIHPKYYVHFLDFFILAFQTKPNLSFYGEKVASIIKTFLDPNSNGNHKEQTRTNNKEVLDYLERMRFKVHKKLVEIKKLLVLLFPQFITPQNLFEIVFDMDSNSPDSLIPVFILVLNQISFLKWEFLLFRLQKIKKTPEQFITHLSSLFFSFYKHQKSQPSSKITSYLIEANKLVLDFLLKNKSHFEITQNLKQEIANITENFVSDIKEGNIWTNCQKIICSQLLEISYMLSEKNSIQWWSWIWKRTYLEDAQELSKLPFIFICRYSCEIVEKEISQVNTQFYQEKETFLELMKNEAFIKQVINNLDLQFVWAFITKIFSQETYRDVLKYFADFCLNQDPSLFTYQFSRRIFKLISAFPNDFPQKYDIVVHLNQKIKFISIKESISQQIKNLQKDKTSNKSRISNLNPEKELISNYDKIIKSKRFCKLNIVFNNNNNNSDKFIHIDTSFYFDKLLQKKEPIIQKLNKPIIQYIYNHEINPNEIREILKVSESEQQAKLISAFPTIITVTKNINIAKTIIEIADEYIFQLVENPKEKFGAMGFYEWKVLHPFLESLKLFIIQNDFTSPDCAHIDLFKEDNLVLLCINMCVHLIKNYKINSKIYPQFKEIFLEIANVVLQKNTDPNFMIKLLIILLSKLNHQIYHEQSNFALLKFEEYYIAHEEKKEIEEENGDLDDIYQQSLEYFLMKIIGNQNNQEMQQKMFSAYSKKSRNETVPYLMKKIIVSVLRTNIPLVLNIKHLFHHLFISEIEDITLKESPLLELEDPVKTIEYIIKLINNVGFKTENEFIMIWENIYKLIEINSFSQQIQFLENYEKIVILLIQALSSLILLFMKEDVGDARSLWFYAPRKQRFDFLQTKPGQELSFLHYIIDQGLFELCQPFLPMFYHQYYSVFRKKNYIHDYFNRNELFFFHFEKRSEPTINENVENQADSTNENKSKTRLQKMLKSPFYINLERPFGQERTKLENYQIRVKTIIYRSRKQLKFQDLEVRKYIDSFFGLLETFISQEIGFSTPAIIRESFHSILLISDLFNFEEFGRLIPILMNVLVGTSEDDYVMRPLLIIGICKTISVLYRQPDLYSILDIDFFSFLTESIKSYHDPIKLAALQGLLYLIEVKSVFVTFGLANFLFEFLIQNLKENQNTKIQLYLLSISFLLVETFQQQAEETGFTNKLIASCIEALENKHINFEEFHCIFRGFENLLVSYRLSHANRKSVTSLIFKRGYENDPKYSLVFLRFLLTILYTENKEDKQENKTISYIMNSMLEKISKAHSFEGEIIAKILPKFVDEVISCDSFVSLVVNQMIDPKTEYPVLISRVLFSLANYIFNQKQEFQPKIHEKISHLVLQLIDPTLAKKNFTKKLWLLCAVFVCSSPVLKIRLLFFNLLEINYSIDNPEQILDIFEIAQLDFIQRIPIKEAKKLLEKLNEWKKGNIIRM
eukprot:Anaeramoba_ignava/c21791_g2_i1.p1 GENE.c21791_g2_i1~~c21791_g2_i1.p1  ORF type:complete len:2531 (+),score=707.32 c21791_g2_i1:258-7850(+)